ncbi:MAG: hypothetical protein EON93_00225 [Burkholderiales bacterium]|nr:MAG: hypothetical protein EON93_00225 [Burkholderiales bacterium]
MCYSAEVKADYRYYVETFNVAINLKEFAKLFWRRLDDGTWVPKIPRAMEAPFLNPKTDEEREIKDAIDRFRDQQAMRLEQSIFKQTKRKADAERTLQTKTTKKAQEDLRISTKKIGEDKRRLENLRRTEAKRSDSRIWPGDQVLILVAEHGKRVLRPMRYFCRMPGWTAEVERNYDGTYNARRDRLETSWKKLFGHQHGLMVADRFYESVAGKDGKSVELEFEPRTGEPMLIACLWAYDPVDDLYSCAAITDDPEPEVAAAGHDRTIINIKPEHIDAWLTPEPGNLAAMYAIFDDKRHPYYEHRLAA